MKKSIFTILCSAVSLGALTGATLSAFPAVSAAENTVLTAEDLSVVVPASYEQYLSLSTPSDVAINDSYLAVADGNSIHLYDKTTGSYSTYLHETNAEERLNTISCMQFGADGRLYFNDSSTTLYTLDCATLTAYNAGLSCSVFALSPSTLYYATVTSGIVTVSEVPASYIDGTSATLIRQVTGSTAPAMALSGEAMYFTVGNALYSNVSEAITTLPATGIVSDIAFVGGTLFFTDTSGKFSVYNMSAGSVTQEYQDTYSALGTYGTSVYVVNGKSVRQYTPSAMDFADYEICDSSSSAKRLKNATDLCLSGDTLIIADRGNKRISLLDTLTGSTLVCPTSIEPDIIATTEDKILISNGTAVAVYDKNGAELTTKASFSGVVVGVTGLYGQFYMVTSNNYCYRLSENFELTSVYKTLDNTAKGLTSDVDGNLYVLYANGSVSRFSETEFNTASATGLNVHKFSNNVSKIFTDFAGNLYGMHENVLYCSDGMVYEFQPDGAVYGEGYVATSYAIDYLEQKIYMLCGDFVLNTSSISLRTLNNILVGGVDAELFASRNANLQVLRTDPNAVCIEIDINTLQNATYFNYLGHGRLNEAKNAILLGTVGESQAPTYYLVAIYNAAEHEYRAYLVSCSSCSVVEQSEYLADASADFPTGTAYLTNDVELYKFPYLSDALTLASLQKSMQVSVQGKLDFNGLDNNYYLVSVSLNGRVYTGYVPTGYFQAFDGVIPPETQMTYTYLTPDSGVTLNAANGTQLTLTQRTQVVVYGDWKNAEQASISYTKDGVTYYATVDTALLESSTQGRWQTMAVLILIGAAIIVGVDFLLLRKGDYRDSLDEY